jgi:hypoxanthine-guanine phosphoribosyltransferase
MDTGLTLEDLRQTIRARHWTSFQVCTPRDRPVTCRRVGMPDHSVVGDGVDDSRYARSCPGMGRLTPAGLGAHGNR